MFKSFWRHLGAPGRLMVRTALRGVAVHVVGQAVHAVDKKTGLPLGELVVNSISPALNASNDAAAQANIAQANIAQANIAQANIAQANIAQANIAQANIASASAALGFPVSGNS